MRPAAGSFPTPRAHDVPFQGEPPAPVPEKLKLPPVQGSLPHTAEDYIKLPRTQKSFALDFLILGQIPPPLRDEATSLPKISAYFEFVIEGCLKRGELNALDFLWQQSDFDPNDSKIKLLYDSLDETSAKCLIGHCRAYPGLKVELVIQAVDGPAVPALASLIEQGSVWNLEFDDGNISPDHLLRFATVAGRIGNNLILRDITFDIHSERAFAESLLASDSLKKLIFVDCDFGASRGVQFVEGMQKNQSIVTLLLRETSLPTSLGSGYGAMLSKNGTLRELGVVAPRGQSVDVDSILIGALSHPALRSIIVAGNQTDYAIAHPESLVRLLEKNYTLSRVSMDVLLPSCDDGKAVAAALSRNTSMTEFAMKWDSFYTEDVQSIRDTLARNRALAEGKIQPRAGEAFDPYARFTNGLSDAGSVIANYVLANSSSLEQFAETMAAVELSMRDVTAQFTGNTTTTAASSSSAGTTTTTTTTTTTGTMPSGPASS